MKKRIILVLNCILLGAVLAFLFLKPIIFGPIQYEWADSSEAVQIKENYTEAAEPFFTELFFSGEKLPYDRLTSTFYLPLNIETKRWETGELSSGSGEVRLLFEEDFAKESKQEAIREGKAFRFYALRGTEYQECFLIATGLPVLSIETTETADTGVFGGMLYYWDAKSKHNWTGANILEAQIRGNTSRTYPKKGYKLTLKNQNKRGEVVPDKKSLFGLRTDDEWILNAMYSDSSKIRDKLSVDLWNEFGARRAEFPEAKFGSDLVYVEVFFNQEYWGLYGLMEPVDSKQLDLTKDEEAGMTEYSYKAVGLRGGDEERLKDAASFEKSLAAFNLKGNHDSTDASAWEPLFSYLTFREQEEDAAFAREAPVLIDMDGAINIWIYFQAVLGIDNRAKNMYYVAKSNNQSYRIYFAPWDMDLTWGDALSVRDEAELKGEIGEPVWNVGLNTDLYSERINWEPGDRLVALNVENTRERIKEKWLMLREGLFSDKNITEHVDNLVHELQDSGALARDAGRWPDSNFGEDYEQFKRMALYRMKFLDYYFDGKLESYMGLGYE